MLDKFFSKKFKGDGIIWTVFFLLCIISIIEVYSASSVLSYKSGNYWSPVLKHFGLLVVGFVCMIVVLNIKCKYFKIVTPFMLLAAFVTLLWVLVAGQSTNGAQRWISLVGIQFQPSEIAKGAMILAVAQILSAMQTERGADRRAFKYIMIVSAFIIPLIMVENLSTAALLCLVILMMMFIGRVPMSQIGRLMGIGMLLLIFAVSMIMLVGKETPAQGDAKMAMTEQTDDVVTEKPSKLEKIFHRAGTWKSRIVKHLDNKEISPYEFDLDKDAQVAHASIVGAVVVCLLYIILLFRTASIANRCVNAFPALLIMGLALLLVTQALFNMLVAVGLVPVTGQPLPLISKGGTSTIINCIYIGVILSVSYSAKKKDDETTDEGKNKQLKVAYQQA